MGPETTVEVKATVNHRILERLTQSDGANARPHRSL